MSDSLRKCAQAACSHWNEFGPDYGMEQKIGALELCLKQTSAVVESPPSAERRIISDVDDVREIATERRVARSKSEEPITTASNAWGEGSITPTAASKNPKRGDPGGTPSANVNACEGMSTDALEQGTQPMLAMATLRADLLAEDCKMMRLELEMTLREHGTQKTRMAELVKREAERDALRAALELIADYNNFNGGTWVMELQGIARAALARAKGE